MERSRFVASRLILIPVVTVMRPWISRPEFLHEIEVHPSDIKEQCWGTGYASSPHVMNAAVAQGYKNLKTTCPSEVIEMFEKTIRLHN